MRSIKKNDLTSSNGVRLWFVLLHKLTIGHFCISSRSIRRRKSEFGLRSLVQIMRCIFHFMYSFQATPHRFNVFNSSWVVAIYYVELLCINFCTVYVIPWECFKWNWRVCWQFCHTFVIKNFYRLFFIYFHWNCKYR